MVFMNMLVPEDDERLDRDGEVQKALGKEAVEKPQASLDSQAPSLGSISLSIFISVAYPSFFFLPSGLFLCYTRHICRKTTLGQWFSLFGRPWPSSPIS
jgi:hypothetical protein